MCCGISLHWEHQSGEYREVEVGSVVFEAGQNAAVGEPMAGGYFMSHVLGVVYERYDSSDATDTQAV